MMHGWYGPGNSWMMGGNYWWMGLIGMVIQLLFWIGIIYLAVRLLRTYLPRNNTPAKIEDNALSIVRERYARGEIDSEQYNKLKQELEK